MKGDGTSMSSLVEVEDEFLGYYQILLETNHACDPIGWNILREGPSLFSEQADFLVRDISPQEIKDALFNIGDEKSPGPYLYSSCFFKKARETIEGDFVDAITEFFDIGSLLKQINHTVIALIPKRSHASTVGISDLFRAAMWSKRPLPKSYPIDWHLSLAPSLTMRRRLL
ncbi:uncharacterized protein LOC111390282 [Olea europaea var. sylvestris]|uniref:uncharacterized protein LOC111390282 n=1 Tax=Olea europaea var. sylvestris TaxID=158386 RepID=UPI000C1D1CEF|nr:uncharacterized protein LOC111390282 [Olea europaea var. sylvestris]